MCSHIEQLEAVERGKNDRTVKIGTVMEFGRGDPFGYSFYEWQDSGVRFSRSQRILSDQLAWFPQVGALLDPNSLSNVVESESDSETVLDVGYSEATNNEWALVLDQLSSQLQGRSVVRLKVDSLGETPLEMFTHVDGVAFVSNGTVLLVNGKLSGDESYSLVGLSPISGEVQFVFPREGLKSYFVESRSNRVVGLFEEEGSYEVRMYRAEDGSLMNSMELDSDIKSIVEIVLRQTAEFPLISYYNSDSALIDLGQGVFRIADFRVSAIDLEGQRLLGRTELPGFLFFDSSDSRFFAYSDETSSKVEVWDVSENSILFEVDNESGEPFVGFSTELDQFLMYDSSAQEIERWDLRSGESLPSIPLVGEDVIHLSVDEFNGRLFVISLSGLLEVIDLESGSERGRIMLPSSRYKSVIPFGEDSVFVESLDNALLKIELVEPLSYSIVARDQFDQCFRIGPENDWLMSNSGEPPYPRGPWNSALLFAQVVDKETSDVSSGFGMPFYPEDYLSDSNEAVDNLLNSDWDHNEQWARLLDASSKDLKVLVASGNENQLFVGLIDLSSEEGPIRLEPSALSIVESGMFWSGEALGAVPFFPGLGPRFSDAQFIEKIDRIVISNGLELQFFDVLGGSYLFTSELKNRFRGDVIQLEASDNSQKVAVVTNKWENPGFSGFPIGKGTKFEPSTSRGGDLEIHDALEGETLYPEFGGELVRSVSFSADGGFLYVLTGESIYSYQLSNGSIEKMLSVQSVNGWDRIDVSPSGRYAILGGSYYPLGDSYPLGGERYSEIAVVDLESGSVGSAHSEAQIGPVYFSDEVEGRFSMFHSRSFISEWEIESGAPVPIRLETSTEGNPQIVLQAEEDMEFLLSKSGDLFSWEDVSVLEFSEGETHIPIEWDEGASLFYRVWKYLVKDPN